MIVTQFPIHEGAVCWRVLWCTNDYTGLHSLQQACGADSSCLFAGRGLSYFFYSLASILGKCLGVLRIKPTAVGIAQIQRHCMSKTSRVNSWYNTHVCGYEHPSSSTITCCGQIWGEQ